MESLHRVLMMTVCGLLACPAFAAEAADLGKIERKIAKEPKYVAQPLYGLYVFGPEARTRVWAVFDKSKEANAEYDVLYFDRNGNGDLTESNERIVGTTSTGQAAFDIGSFTDPATGQTHTKLSITRHGGANPMVMFRMMWQDKIQVVGGYAEDPGPYTQFSPRIADAPILWPSADGPLSFQRWMGGKLSIGGADDMRVFLGHQGVGKNTFSGLPQTFLPENVAVLATVIYTDAEGKERRLQSELKSRC